VVRSADGPSGTQLYIAHRDQTAWLTMQSGANPSQQAKFPDNREKYREKRKFGLQMAMASLANAATMRVLSEIRYRN
jgi:hypothetical protein